MVWRFFPIVPEQMGVSRHFRIGLFDAPTQRISWVNVPEPDPARLSGKLSYADEAHIAAQGCSTVPRRRNCNKKSLKRGTIRHFWGDEMNGAADPRQDLRGAPDLSAQRAPYSVNVRALPVHFRLKLGLPDNALHLIRI